MASRVDILDCERLKAWLLQEKAKKMDAKPTVRERLAKKLLTGKAQERAAGDLDAVQEEHFKDLESQRW